ncbi:MAG TPA: HEAT repeat domain-containing protein [Opitutaceae bacterium]|nr:HEAT repeat domain-containing protein [Opitutaceae bacterium]
MNRFPHLLFALALATAVLRAADAVDPLTINPADPAFWPTMKATDYAADPRILDRLDVAVAEAGRDPAKLAELERQLVAFFSEAGVTPAARQAAAQRLGTVLAATPGAKADATLVILGRALRDEAGVDDARLALDFTPGAAIDALYVEALRESSGRTRLALLQGAAARRIEAAVPVAAPWLKSDDATLAAAAAHALGQIGGTAALRALDSAPDAWSPQVVDARLAAATTAPARAAGRIYESIYGNPGAPDPQRATALRGMIAVRPGSAVKYVQQTLSGNVPAFQQAALESVATLRSDDVVRQLSTQLPRWTPDVQLAVIAAFGRRGEAGAAAALTSLLTSDDVAVRHAAIEALGRLPGTTQTAQLLARVAAAEGDDAKSAAAALARLNGAGIDEFVLAGATKGDASLRPVFIGQLARRGQIEAIPTLQAMRGEPEASIRLAALEALGELAPPAEQAALLDWALHATDTAEQNRAVRSLISVLLRDDAKDTRAASVLAAMESGDASARLALLPVLPRVGGKDALARLAQLAGGDDAKVAAAAVTNLGRWTGNEAAGALVGAAEKSADADVRRAAVGGAIRVLEKERDAADLDEVALLGRLLAVAGDKEQKTELLWLLSRSGDAGALEIADKHAGDPEVADVAKEVADAIRSNRDWPPAVTASGASDKVFNLTDGKTSTSWAVPAKADAWLEVDFKHARPIRRLTLDPARGSESPEELEVFVSDDPASWGEPRLTHTGENGRNVLALPAGTRGRYMRLVHTGTRDEGNWSVAELTVE